MHSPPNPRQSQIISPKISHQSPSQTGGITYHFIQNNIGYAPIARHYKNPIFLLIIFFLLTLSGLIRDTQAFIYSGCFTSSQCLDDLNSPSPLPPDYYACSRSTIFSLLQEVDANFPTQTSTLHCVPTPQNQPVTKVEIVTLGFQHSAGLIMSPSYAITIPQIDPITESETVLTVTWTFTQPLIKPRITTPSTYITISPHWNTLTNPDPQSQLPVNSLTVGISASSSATETTTGVFLLTYYDPLLMRDITVAPGVYHLLELAQCKAFTEFIGQLLLRPTELIIPPQLAIEVGKFINPTTNRYIPRKNTAWVQCKGWPRGYSGLLCKSYYIGPWCSDIAENIAFETAIIQNGDPLIHPPLPDQLNPTFASYAPVIFPSYVKRPARCGFVPTVTVGTNNEDFIVVDVCRSIFLDDDINPNYVQPTVITLPHISKMHLYGFDNDDYPLLAPGQIASNAKKTNQGLILTEQITSATLTAKLILDDGRVIYGPQFEIKSDCDAWGLPCSKRSTLYCDRAPEDYKPKFFQTNPLPVINFYQCKCELAVYNKITLANIRSDQSDHNTGLLPEQTKSWATFTCDDLSKPFRRDVDLMDYGPLINPNDPSQSSKHVYSVQNARTLAFQVSNELYINDASLSGYLPTIPLRLPPSSPNFVESRWGLSFINSDWNIGYHNVAQPTHTPSDNMSLFLPYILTPPKQNPGYWAVGMVALMFNPEDTRTLPQLPIHPLLARAALIPSSTHPLVMRAYRTNRDGTGCLEGYYGQECQFFIPKPVPWKRDVFYPYDTVSFSVTLDGTFGKPSLTCSLVVGNSNQPGTVVFTQGAYDVQSTWEQMRPQTQSFTIPFSLWLDLGLNKSADDPLAPENSIHSLSIRCVVTQQEYNSVQPISTPQKVSKESSFVITDFIRVKKGCLSFCNGPYAAGCQLTFPFVSSSNSYETQYHCSCDDLYTQYIFDSNCSVFFPSDPRLGVPSPLINPTNSPSTLIEANMMLSYQYGDTFSYVFSIATVEQTPRDGYYLSFTSILASEYSEGGSPPTPILIPIEPSPVVLPTSTSSHIQITIPAPRDELVQQISFVIKQEIFPLGVYTMRLVRKSSDGMIQSVIRWNHQNVYKISIHPNKMAFLPDYSFPKGPKVPILRVSWSPSSLPQPTPSNQNFNELFYRIGIVVENSCRHSLFGSYTVPKAQITALPDRSILSVEEWNQLGIVEETVGVESFYRFKPQSMFPSTLSYVDLDITNHVHILSTTYLCIEPINLNQFFKPNPEAIPPNPKFIPSRGLARFSSSPTLKRPQLTSSTLSSFQTKTKLNYNLSYNDIFSASLKIVIPETMPRCLNGGIPQKLSDGMIDLSKSCLCPVRFYGFFCHLERPGLLPSSTAMSTRYSYLQGDPVTGSRFADIKIDDEDDDHVDEGDGVDKFTLNPKPNTVSQSSTCTLRCPIPLQSDSQCSQCICLDDYCRITTRIMYLEAGPRVEQLSLTDLTFSFPKFFDNYGLDVLHSRSLSILSKTLAYTPLSQQIIAELNVLFGLHVYPLANTLLPTITSLPLFPLTTISSSQNPLTLPSLGRFTPNTPIGMESISIQPQVTEITGELPTISMLIVIHITPFSTYSSVKTNEMLFNQRFKEIQSTLTIFSLTHGMDMNDNGDQRGMYNFNHQFGGSLSLFGPSEYTLFALKSTPRLLQPTIGLPILNTMCSLPQSQLTTNAISPGPCPTISTIDLQTSPYWPRCESNINTIRLLPRCFISGIPQQPLPFYEPIGNTTPTDLVNYEIFSTETFAGCSSLFPNYPNTLVSPCAHDPSISIITPPYIIDHNELVLGGNYEVLWKYSGPLGNDVLIFLSIQYPLAGSEIPIRSQPLSNSFQLSSITSYQIAIVDAMDMYADITIPLNLVERLTGGHNRDSELLATLHVTVLNSPSSTAVSEQQFIIRTPQQCTQKNEPLSALTCHQLKANTVCDEVTGSCQCVPPFYQVTDPRLLPPSIWEQTSASTTLLNVLDQCVIPCDNGGTYNPMTKGCSCGNSQYSGLRCELTLETCPLNAPNTILQHLTSQSCSYHGYHNSTSCTSTSHCVCLNNFFGDRCEKCSLTGKSTLPRNPSLWPPSSYCNEIGTEWSQTEQRCSKCLCKYGYFGDLCQYQGVVTTLNFTTSNQNKFHLVREGAHELFNGTSYQDWLLNQRNLSTPNTSVHNNDYLKFNTSSSFFVIPSPYYDLGYDYHLKSDIGLSLGVNPETISVLQTYSTTQFAWSDVIAEDQDVSITIQDSYTTSNQPNNDLITTTSTQILSFPNPIINVVIVAIHLGNNPGSSMLSSTAQDGGDDDNGNNSSATSTLAQPSFSQPLSNQKGYRPVTPSIFGIQQSPHAMTLTSVKTLWSILQSAFPSRFIATSPIQQSLGTVTSLGGVHDPNCIPEPTDPSNATIHICSNDNAPDPLALLTAPVIDPEVVLPPKPAVPTPWYQTTAFIGYLVLTLFGLIVLLLILFTLVAIFAHFRAFVLVGLLKEDLTSRPPKSNYRYESDGEIDFYEHGMRIPSPSQSLYTISATTWPLCTFPILRQQRCGNKTPRWFYTMTCRQHRLDNFQKLSIDPNLYLAAEKGRTTSKYIYVVTSGIRLRDDNRLTRLNKIFPPNQISLMEYCDSRRAKSGGLLLRPAKIGYGSAQRFQPVNEYVIFSPGYFTGYLLNFPATHPVRSSLPPILKHDYDYMNMATRYFKDDTADDDDSAFGYRSDLSRADQTRQNTMSNAVPFQPPEVGIQQHQSNQKEFQQQQLRHQQQKQFQLQQHHHQNHQRTIQEQDKSQKQVESQAEPHQIAVGNLTDQSPPSSMTCVICIDAKPDSTHTIMGSNAPSQPRFHSPDHNGADVKEFSSSSITPTSKSHSRIGRKSVRDSHHDSSDEETVNGTKTTSPTTKNCDVYTNKTGTTYTADSSSPQGVVNKAPDFDPQGSRIIRHKHSHSRSDSRSTSHVKSLARLQLQEEASYFKSMRGSLSLKEADEEAAAAEEDDEQSIYTPSTLKATQSPPRKLQRQTTSNTAHNYPNPTVQLFESGHNNNSDHNKQGSLVTTFNAQHLSIAWPSQKISNSTNSDYEIRKPSMYQSIAIGNPHIFSDLRYLSYQNYVISSTMSVIYPVHLGNPKHRAAILENIFFTVWLKQYLNAIRLEQEVLKQHALEIASTHSIGLSHAIVSDDTISNCSNPPLYMNRHDQHGTVSVIVSSQPTDNLGSVVVGNMSETASMVSRGSQHSLSTEQLKHRKLLPSSQFSTGFNSARTLPAHTTQKIPNNFSAMSPVSVRSFPSSAPREVIKSPSPPHPQILNTLISTRNFGTEVLLYPFHSLHTNQIFRATLYSLLLHGPAPLPPLLLPPALIPKQTLLVPMNTGNVPEPSVSHCSTSSSNHAVQNRNWFKAMFKQLPPGSPEDPKVISPSRVQITTGGAGAGIEMTSLQSHPSSLSANSNGNSLPCPHLGELIHNLTELYKLRSIPFTLLVNATLKHPYHQPASARQPVVVSRNALVHDLNQSTSTNHLSSTTTPTLPLYNNPTNDDTNFESIGSEVGSDAQSWISDQSSNADSCQYQFSLAGSSALSTGSSNNNNIVRIMMNNNTLTTHGTHLDDATSFRSNNPANTANTANTGNTDSTMPNWHGTPSNGTGTTPWSDGGSWEESYDDEAADFFRRDDEDDFFMTPDVSSRPKPTSQPHRPDKQLPNTTPQNTKVKPQCDQQHPQRHDGSLATINESRNYLPPVSSGRSNDQHYAYSLNHNFPVATPATSSVGSSAISSASGWTDYAQHPEYSSQRSIDQQGHHHNYIHPQNHIEFERRDGGQLDDYDDDAYWPDGEEYE